MRSLVLVFAALVTLAPRAHAKGCHEHSLVVGYEHCSWFGTWSRDAHVNPFHLEVGWLHETYVARPFTLPGGPLVASTAAGNPSAVVSDGTATRYLAGIPGSRVFYGGLELDVGVLTTQPQFAGLPASGSSMAGLAVVGAHASLWRFAGGVELAGGGGFTVFSYCTTKECAQSDTQGGGELEARIRAEVFIDPRWSVGVAYGHSLVERDAHSLFVYTGVHFRALDGMY